MKNSESVAVRNSGKHNLHLTWLKANQLKPYAKNARTHSEKQIQQIADVLFILIINVYLF